MQRSPTIFLINHNFLSGVNWRELKKPMKNAFYIYSANYLFSIRKCFFYSLKIRETEMHKSFLDGGSTR